MKHHKSLIALTFIAGTLIFFYFGQNSDRRCEGTCLGEVVARYAKDNFKINFINESTQPGEPEEFSRQWHELIQGEKRNPERQTLAKVIMIDPSVLSTISIKSYLTEWIIVKSEDDSASVSFQGYLEPSEWTIDPRGQDLYIDTEKKGPLKAELRLPKNFQGNLSLVNEKGAFHVEELANTDRLKIINVDGDIVVNSSPRRELEIKTVYGNTRFAPKQNSADLELIFESASGDVLIDLSLAVKDVRVETLTGDLKLLAPASLGWSYELEGLYIRARGIPELDTQNIVMGSLQGTWGPEPMSQLRYETLKGNFLVQIEEK